ncbi:MAG: four helix bundle protein [Parcubacteria group bacterium]|jgi:four helix bundle protein
MKQYSNKYNLEERTAIFGENIIELCKSITPTIITRPLISQIMRSGTSIGANYCEANNASSKKDFRNKIFICKKEGQETKHWLRMLVKCDSEKREQAAKLWKECQELTLIFQKIINSTK